MWPSLQTPIGQSPPPLAYHHKSNFKMHSLLQQLSSKNTKLVANKTMVFDYLVDFLDSHQNFTLISIAIK